MMSLYMYFSKCCQVFRKQWFTQVISQVKSTDFTKDSFVVLIFFAEYCFTDSISLIFVMEISIISIAILNILVLKTTYIFFLFPLQIKTGILLLPKLLNCDVSNHYVPVKRCYFLIVNTEALGISFKKYRNKLLTCLYTHECPDNSP